MPVEFNQKGSQSTTKLIILKGLEYIDFYVYLFQNASESTYIYIYFLTRDFGDEGNSW